MTLEEVERLSRAALSKLIQLNSVRDESNGSITLLDLNGGTGLKRQLNINTYSPANELSGYMSLAILDENGNLVGDVVLDNRGIRTLLVKIGELI